MAVVRRVGRWSSAVVVGASVLVACAAPASDASADGAGFHVQREGSAWLTVIRDDSLASVACPIEILVDAQLAGSLEPKGWITVYPAPGAHEVSIRAPSAACPATGPWRARLEADRHQRLRLVRDAISGTLRLVPAPGDDS